MCAFTNKKHVITGGIYGAVGGRGKEGGRGNEGSWKGLDRYAHLHNVQQALGQLFSSRGVSSLIFCAVLMGRGSSTCSTKLP